MIYHFKKKLTCGKNCQEDFTQDVIDLCPIFSAGINGHISISHSKPYHEIWVTFYNDGKHENFRSLDKTHHKVISTKLDKNQKKFRGNIPTLAQLQNL